MNFDERIWDAELAYDEPMLTRFAFGAWLYPKYLKEKKFFWPQFDYTTFLIMNGFYTNDSKIPSYHESYKVNKDRIVTIEIGDVGTDSYFIEKYGANITKSLDLIWYTRKLNYFFLAVAVVVLWILLLRFKGLFFSFLFLIFYGYNTLLINWGVYAHSEPLFLLLFNLSIFFACYYFVLKRNVKYLFLFSFFVGLTMSAKINGIMLLIPFYVCLFLDLFRNYNKISKLNIVLGLVLPAAISLSVFVLLHPTTYKNPRNTIPEMYEFRKKATVRFAEAYPHTFLPTTKAKFTQIFENFYFGKDYYDFNGLKFIASNIKYGTFLFALFLIGLFVEIKRMMKDKKLPRVILIFFFTTVVVMTWYLSLNWTRYYIQLVFFFIYYQFTGLFSIADFLFTRKIVILKYFKKR